MPFRGSETPIPGVRNTDLGVRKVVPGGPISSFGGSDSSFRGSENGVRGSNYGKLFHLLYIGNGVLSDTWAWYISGTCFFKGPNRPFKEKHTAIAE